jgi:hypothetical protein
MILFKTLQNLLGNPIPKMILKMQWRVRRGGESNAMGMEVKNQWEAKVWKEQWGHMCLHVSPLGLLTSDYVFSLPAMYQFWRKDCCFATNLPFCSLDIWLVSGRLNSVVHITLYAFCWVK